MRVFAALILAALPSGLWSNDLGGLRDSPRVFDGNGALSGYDAIDTELTGEPARPRPTIEGLYLVLNMFRQVCLGVERGQSLAEVLPPGFAGYERLDYFWGDLVTSTEGNLVLSATGLKDRDAGEGRPVFRIQPAEDGAICSLTWETALDPDPAQTEFMVFLIVREWPYLLGAVRAGRPLPVPTPQTSDIVMWDRVCGARWCPLVANYDISRGRIALETRLNLTEIGGERP